MSGVETLIVGYRHGSRKIHELRDRYGLGAVQVRKCIAGCGHPVSFVASGYQAAWDRDCAVVCDVCRERMSETDLLGLL